MEEDSCCAVDLLGEGLEQFSPLVPLDVREILDQFVDALVELQSESRRIITDATSAALFSGSQVRWDVLFLCHVEHNGGIVNDAAVEEYREPE